METWTRVAAEETEKKQEDDGCILEAQPAEMTGGLDVGDKAKAEIEGDDMQISDLNRIFSILHFSDIQSLLCLCVVTL